MDSIFVQALLVGILVTLAIYLSISKAFDTRENSIRRPLGLFAGILGLLTTIWLSKHTAMLERYIIQIVAAGIAVLLALLALGKKLLDK